MSDCSGFIEFMLQAIADSLDEAIATKAPVQTTVEERERTPGAILSTLCSQPELTLAEDAQVIGRSRRTVARAAAKLKAEDRLRYIGPKKGGRWEAATGGSDEQC